MQKIIQLCLFFCCFVFAAKAQLPDYVNHKEKLYVHTNHTFFKQGEQLFYKVYVVQAQDNTPTTISSSVQVEMLNPAGAVIQKKVYQVYNGYAEGSFDFDVNAVGGIYTLKAYTSWMQNEKDSTFFTKELTVQQVITPRILMKLDFPKKGYGAAEEVIALFSMKSLDNMPIKLKTVHIVAMVDGKMMYEADATTNYQGQVTINFMLPATLSSADGLLNITAMHEGYKETISRSIPLASQKIDLQFLPEGGSFVAGVATHVAIKAVNEQGKPADVKGYIVNQSGHIVTQFDTYHFGMGKFPFTPVAQEQYSAIITQPAGITQQYRLPMAASHGVVMNIQSDSLQSYITLNSTMKMPVKLVATCRNVVGYHQTIQLQKGSTQVVVPHHLFATGIVQFTVYVDNKEPVAERLVFVNRDKVLQVEIKANKEKYLPREKVVLTLTTKDAQNKPIATNFSLAVVDDKLWTYADDKQAHLLAWLLLTSELKGKVEEPNFYFNKEEAKSLPALDLLMLTQGYRYFQFISYVQQYNQLKYSPDLGYVLSGVVLDTANRPMQADVYLVGAWDATTSYKMHTDEEGQFCFTNLPNATSFYILAKADKKKIPLHIQVLQNGVGSNQRLAKKMQRISAVTAKDFEAIKQIAQANKADMKMEQQKLGFDAFNQLDKNGTHLDEVVVVGYGAAQKRRDLVGSIAIVRAKELEVAVPNIAEVLQGKVAGLLVQQEANPGAGTHIRIRGVGSIIGDNEPLIVLNGVPISNQVLQTINPSFIDHVSVLKDASATAIYGSRAANGVIVIESKKYNKERINFQLAKKSYFAVQPVYTQTNSYAIARKFYAPAYLTLDTDERTDFRETIYWNGVVQTNAQGQATVEFYNSDATTTFRAIAEGVAGNGVLGRTEFTYPVQNALVVDAKIPPYLTVGDQPLIPVNIKNNALQTLQLQVSASTVTSIRIGAFTSQLTLAPNEAKEIYLPLQILSKVSNALLNITVTSDVVKEKITLPIQAEEKGFKVTETFSGNTSTQHSFLVNQPIEGSIQTDLKLFNNLEGHLLNGIESMLQEPYGCFEQTSSTTYPNIFILKYLKESGKLNAAIEQKALNYIEKGYQRLIGFETAQHGFEWFGKTPPHEALTAYGLLEFTDMQAFISVDKKMLERTKQFLLSRKDGKGGFLLATGGYDRFASVPNKIANIYIVYALSQAALGKEILPEYQFALQQALQSKDAYQMALMALAASNMNQQADFQQLLQLLKQAYLNNQLIAETSVVNSRDVSLRVETRALLLLALAREQQPDLSTMASLLSSILSEKSYYGYGSTQATVLALNAVVTYGKLTKHVASNNAVQFVCNNQVVYAGSNSINNIVAGSNRFLVQYTAGSAGQAVPYQMQVSYHTLTPPNSSKAVLQLHTKLDTNAIQLAKTARLTITATNKANALQPMAIAKIGIPAGLSLQPWQLKEIMEKNQVAYYEIFDNYLVFYWMGFAPNETKTIAIDLKADIPGQYQAKASTIYLYYTPEYKHWNAGTSITILP